MACAVLDISPGDDNTRFRATRDDLERGGVHRAPPRLGEGRLSCPLPLEGTSDPWKRSICLPCAFWRPDLYSASAPAGRRRGDGCGTRFPTRLRTGKRTAEPPEIRWRKRAAARRSGRVGGGQSRSETSEPIRLAGEPDAAIPSRRNIWPNRIVRNSQQGLRLG